MHKLVMSEVQVVVSSLICKVSDPCFKCSHLFMLK